MEFTTPAIICLVIVVIYVAVMRYFWWRTKDPNYMKYKTIESPEEQWRRWNAKKYVEEPKRKDGIIDHNNKFND